MSLTADWNYPTPIHVGAGRINELPKLCRGMGLHHPLLVTDPGLAELPMTQAALESLTESGIKSGMFSAIKANPSRENIDSGVDCFRSNRHDSVIAFGGGSALDAAKAIALMAGQNRPIWDFEDIGDNWTRVNSDAIAPVIAIPTTAGTGSEVGRASVITDTEQRVKKIIFHPRMLPSQVILDPELTVGLPRHITAATGMDALSHNLEAYCSPFYHPMAHGIAVEGISLARRFLPTAVEQGHDLEARTQMLVCSSMGATAFQKGLGGMHALAHPLGALFDAHHGTLNAILMPYVLKANAAAIEGQITRLSSYLELASPGFDTFIRWVLDLRSRIGIPRTLEEIGIDDRHADLVGDMAVRDPSAGGNPIAFNSVQYEEIFLTALRGEL